MPTPNPEAAKPSLREIQPPPPKKTIKSARGFQQQVIALAETEAGKPVALVEEKGGGRFSLTEAGHQTADKLYQQLKETSPNSPDYQRFLTELRQIKEEMAKVREQAEAITQGVDRERVIQASEQESLLLEKIETRHLGEYIEKVTDTTNPWEIYKTVVAVSNEQLKSGVSANAMDALSENLDKLSSYGEISQNEDLKRRLEQAGLAKFYAQRKLKQMQLEGESPSAWKTACSQVAKSDHLPKGVATYNLAGHIQAIENTVQAEIVNKLGEQAQNYSASEISQAIEMTLHQILPQSELSADQAIKEGETAKQYLHRLTGIEETKGKRKLTNETLRELVVDKLVGKEKNLLSETGSAEVAESLNEVSPANGSRVMGWIKEVVTGENAAKILGHIKEKGIRETAIRAAKKAAAYVMTSEVVWNPQERARIMHEAQFLRMATNIFIPGILAQTDQLGPVDLPQLSGDFEINFGNLLSIMPDQAEEFLRSLQHGGIQLDPVADFLSAQADWVSTHVHAFAQELRTDFGSMIDRLIPEAHAAEETGGVSPHEMQLAPEAQAQVGHPSIKPEEYYPGPSPAPATSPETTATPHLQVPEETQLRQEMKELRSHMAETTGAHAERAATPTPAAQPEIPLAKKPTEAQTTEAPSTPAKPPEPEKPVEPPPTEPVTKPAEQVTMSETTQAPKLPYNLQKSENMNGMEIHIDEEGGINVVPQGGRNVCGYSAIATGIDILDGEIIGGLDQFEHNINYDQLEQMATGQGRQYDGVEFVKADIVPASDLYLKLLRGESVTQQEYTDALNAVTDYYKGVLESGKVATFVAEASPTGFAHAGLVVGIHVEGDRVELIVTDGNDGWSASQLKGFGFQYTKQIGRSEIGTPYITFNLNHKDFFRYFMPFNTLEIRPLGTGS